MPLTDEELEEVFEIALELAGDIMCMSCTDEFPHVYECNDRLQELKEKSKST
jgi:hypothetical protein